MQKYGEIKDLVNAVLESYDKYPGPSKHRLPAAWTTVRVSTTFWK